MTPELRHEIAAIRTTRSAWLLAAAATVTAGAAGWRQAALASAAAAAVPGGAAGSPIAALTGGQTTAYLTAPAIAAGLTATVLLVGRYHGPTATVTFTLLPRRSRVFAASLLVVTGYAAVVALLGAAAAWSVWRISGPPGAGVAGRAELGAFLWFAGVVVAAAWSGVAAAIVLRRAATALAVLGAVLAVEALLTRHVLGGHGLPVPGGLRHAVGTLAGDATRPLGIDAAVLAPSAVSGLAVLLGGACVLLACGALVLRLRDI